jgi:lipoprotein signal peptidase
VQFFIITTTLEMVAEMLYFNQIAIFLQNVLNFVPNVVVAVIILAVGLIAGNALGNLVTRTTEGNESLGNMGSWLSALARWSVIIFALMTALIQVGVAASLIQILFTGIVVAMSLAAGLAFGLGGRDRAHDLIDKMNDTVENMPRA